MTTKINETTNDLISAWVKKIDSAISDIYEKNEEYITGKAKRLIISIQARLNAVRLDLSKGDITTEFIENISNISKKSADLQAIGQNLHEEASAGARLRIHLLSKTVGNGSDLLIKLKDEHPIASRQHKGLESLKSFDESMRNIESRIKRSENLTKISDERLEKISKDIKSKVDEVLATYKRTEVELLGRLQSVDKTIENIREKEEEVNTLVGIVSGTSIAGSYSESAAAELSLANSMRNGSVFLMLAISMLVGYSLLETSSPHFDWQTSIFRLIFSVALSVPAAYLSRESAKHRIKQYEFQKISLDLQSISPYLASLPIDEQHKLKSDMAGRIFTPVAVTSQQESYPIDIQSLLHKIIDKIPQNKESQSSTGKSSATQA